MEYIYLIQEREFIKTGENIYKPGRTEQENNKRFVKYPKGSVVRVLLTCSNCKMVESMIKVHFRNKYIQRTDVGQEYFEGNWMEMREDIWSLVSIFDKKTDNFEQLDIILKKIEHNNFKTDIPLATLIDKYFELLYKKPLNFLGKKSKGKKSKGSKSKCSRRSGSKSTGRKSSDSKYICKRCTYSTNDKCNYEKHLNRKIPCNINRIHKNIINDKHFFCKECDHKFASNQSLTRHNNTFHDNINKQNNNIQNQINI